jgi:PBP1b-binding outer membrane lipoprotein LpoB
MKAIAITLLIISAGLFITGCSRSVDTQIVDADRAAVSSVQSEDFIDQANTSPDIGMLDDSPVSEDLPQ